MSLDTSAVVETARMSSPIGELELVARDGAICEIRLVEPAGRGGHAREPAPVRASVSRGEPAELDGVLAEARRQLAEYFAGRRRSFELPLATAGTPFQRRVWEALTEVGYGQTATYAELARAIGKPRAARAVGAALARNPVPVVVPCHRVIGAAGDLRGFGLGGVSVKRSLLDAEAARP